MGLARPASACSPPVEGWFYSLKPEGPANGVISLSVSCSVGCSTGPQASDVTLRGLSGDIMGTVTAWNGTNERYFAFKPSAPLTAGQTYWVTVPGARDPNDNRPVPSASVPVVPTPALTWSDAPPVTQHVVAVERPSGKAVCCSSTLESCGSDACFSPEFSRTAAVVVSWDPQSDAVERRQYESRVFPDGVDEALWSYPLSAQMEMGESQDSVCYILELRRLVDGVVIHNARRCVARPADFADVGIFESDKATIANTLSLCDVPPTGYEGQWCSARGCTGKTTDECRICGAVVPGAGGAGGDRGDAAGAGGDATGGTTGAAGATATGGDSELGGGASSQGGTSERGGSSAKGGRTHMGGSTSIDGNNTTPQSACDCSVPGGRPAPAAFGLAALGALGLVARRRKGSWRAAQRE